MKIILKTENTFKSNTIKTNTINITIDINKSYIINKTNIKIKEQESRLKVWIKDIKV